jgi:hypothetical protein
MASFPKSKISLGQINPKHLTQGLDICCQSRFLKSICRFGFSSGFLFVLNLFHNNIKYLINKSLKNKVKSIAINLNKGRKVKTNSIHPSLSRE